MKMFVSREEISADTLDVSTAQWGDCSPGVTDDLLFPSEERHWGRRVLNKARLRAVKLDDGPQSHVLVRLVSQLTHSVSQLQTDSVGLRSSCCCVCDAKQKDEVGRDFQTASEL